MSKIGTIHQVHKKLTIGDECRIGANAIVLNDLTKGATAAVGALAKAVRGYREKVGY